MVQMKGNIRMTGRKHVCFTGRLSFKSLHVPVNLISRRKFHTETPLAIWFALRTKLTNAIRKDRKIRVYAKIFHQCIFYVFDMLLTTCSCIIGIVFCKDLTKDRNAFYCSPVLDIKYHFHK